MSDDGPGDETTTDPAGGERNGTSDEAAPETAPTDEAAPETAPTDENGADAEATEADVPTDGSEWTPPWLADLRADADRRQAALVAAAMVGVLLSAVHWLGLFVAGALVGLVSRTLPRAVAAGLGVGVLVLAVHVGASPTMGAGEFLALAPASYVTLGAALVAPVWGSLVRGVL